MGQRDFTGELRISTGLGETEPLMLTETVLAADKSLDTEFAKSYSQVVALNVRACVKKQTHP